MKGADILVKCLIALKVDTVFGYPGAAILDVYDALYKNKSKIRHILSSHEQFAAHSADGYARSSGKVGVVLATSGPGATNLVTGIATAFMDSIPIVAITANVPLSKLGKDSFQEIDITGVTMPITKHNYIVKSADELAYILKNAFRIAMSGRKGPVLVDIPSDILSAEVKFSDFDTEIINDLPMPDEDSLNYAAELINSSKHPFICAGGGVIRSDASEELTEFAEKIDASVAMTAMGLGSIPCDNDLCAGVVGVYSGDSTLSELKNADLFIAVGMRFSDKLIDNLNEYSADCKTLHIDIDAAEIGKIISPYSNLVGDAKQILKALMPKIKSHEKKEHIRVERKSNSVSYIFDLLNKEFPEAVYTTEVGLHQLWACNMLNIKYPRQFITSGGLGTMGFGLPAAIGAAIACSEKCVINIAGDGSFNMNLQELATAVKYKVNLIQIVFNNHSLGMIEQWQRQKYGGRIFECRPKVKTDYSALAKAFGAKAYTVDDSSDMERVLKNVKNKSGTRVIIIDSVCFE